MPKENLKKSLCFYFITDDHPKAANPVDQVKAAIQGGASFVQYRHKSFSMNLYHEVLAVRHLCQANQIPFVVNDHILLAKAVDADGVHLGQTDESPAVARKILGSQALVGISVSTAEELKQTDLSACDYIGTGPVFKTATKADGKPVIGLSGLKAVVEQAHLPVIAIGGITDVNGPACFENGASGVAVISFITRAPKPEERARMLGRACRRPNPHPIRYPWNDEFALIRKLVRKKDKEDRDSGLLRVPAGDDAALLGDLKNPVVTTDTQKEGVHFRLDRQTPKEVGYKAVEATLSDLAASYARPLYLFINLSLPVGMSDHMVEALYRGIYQALHRHDCLLGGGNLSSGKDFSIDLFAVGRGHDTLFPRRSGAVPGQGLYCTGPLGLARAGLLALEYKDDGFNALIDKFKRPAARFDAAEILARNRVDCVIDISDGLAGDAAHIARASSVTVKLVLKDDCLDPLFKSFCFKYRLDPQQTAMTGGEDYELLFSCEPETFINIKDRLPDSYQVGHVLPFNGNAVITPYGRPESFQHGRKEA